MEQPPRKPVDALWEQIWKLIYHVDARSWQGQGPLFRELARLCMAAAAACEEESDGETHLPGSERA
jgi:hypothetical protein